jgi:hypothetical protein
MSHASESDRHMLKGIARKIGTDADIIARVLLDVLEHEAWREKAAEKPSQPQPGAGVETAEEFWLSACKTSTPMAELIRARDSTIAAAARAKAIEDCTKEIIRSTRSLVETADFERGARYAATAIRALLPPTTGDAGKGF